MLGLVGLKKGMSRVFKDDGNSIPVTVIKIEDSKIVQRKTQEKDGYFGIQVNYGSKKNVSKSNKKKFKDNVEKAEAFTKNITKAKSEASAKIQDLQTKYESMAKDLKVKIDTH